MATETKPHLNTQEFEISWGMIVDWIAAGLLPIAKGKIKSDEDVRNIKFGEGMDYGYWPLDKVIKITTVSDTGVRIIKFG